MKYLLLLVLSLIYASASAQSGTSIYFDISSTQLDNNSQQHLDSLFYYNILVANKRYSIIGYADNTGAEEKNLELSNQRAMAVFNHLQYLGIDSANLKVIVGKGAIGAKNIPIEKNRRVDIIVDTTRLPPPPKPIQVDIKKIKPGEKFKLDRLFFVGGIATLTDSSKPTLEYLLNIMQENPRLMIRLEGHVHHQNIKYRVPNSAFRVRNNRTLDASLQKLSDDRAYAVYKYLIDNGIEEKRLRWKGFSYSKFHESSQNNRRVEVKILAK